MGEGGEIVTPELKSWSLENFGQAVKVSSELSPETFPYIVNIPLESNFFRRAYDGVYRGKGVTVRGFSEGAKKPRFDTNVEHIALMGANDLGEIMVSKEIFEGDSDHALTDISKPKYHDHMRLLLSLGLPPGWRTFGQIHSHPYRFLRRYKERFSSKYPKVEGHSVSWSLGDFQSFLETSKYGHRHLTTLGVITQTQLGLMVASNITVEVVKKKDSEITQILNNPNRQSSKVPFNKFKKFGVVLYGGNHFGKRTGMMELKRLI